MRLFTLIALLTLSSCTPAQSKHDPVQQYRLENQDKVGNIVEDFYFQISQDTNQEIAIFNRRTGKTITLEDIDTDSFPLVRMLNDGIYEVSILQYVSPNNENAKSPTVNVGFYMVKMLNFPKAVDCRVNLKLSDLNMGKNEDLSQYVGSYLDGKGYIVPGMTCTDYKYRAD